MKRSLKPAGLCVLFMTLLVFPAPAMAQNKLPICMEEYPPFEFTKNGRIIGIDTEIVVHVLKRIGYEAEIESLPWKRCLQYTKTGKLAAIYSLTYSEERARERYYSDPINSVRDVFFKLKSSNITWNTFDDLKAYKLGISAGYNYAPEFMDALKKKKFKYVDALPGESLNTRHFMKLLAGYTDIAIMEVTAGQYLIKTERPKFDLIDYMDKSVGEVRPFHIGFSKRWPDAENIVEKFNAELARFIAEGKRDKIFIKYGITPPAK